MESEALPQIKCCDSRNMYTTLKRLMGASVTGIENWRPIVGYEDSYEVSDLGRVRSLDRLHPFNGAFRSTKGRVLKPLNHPGGYQRVALWKDGIYRSAFIHALVLVAFVGPRPPRAEAAHNDGSKTNNSLANLRWASPSENQGDREWHGTGRTGKPHTCARLDADIVRRVRQHYLLTGLSISELARHFGLPRTTVADVVRNRTWRQAR